MSTKRFLLALAAIVLPLLSSAETVEIDGIRYNLTYVPGKVQFAEVIHKSYTDKIVIPSNVNYQEVNYSVTSIAEFAFQNCPGLNSVTIGNNVTSIGANAFYNCPGLTSISVESGNKGYDSRDNCNAIIETLSNTLIYGCKNTKIPNSVTSIGTNAFYNCTGIYSVNIPNSVTSINSGAFRGCTSLTSVIIPDGVTSIGGGAFRDCTGLTSITIGNNVTSIGDHAFFNCIGLTSVTIPNSVGSIGDGAFYGCTSLTSIHISDLVAWCNIVFYDNPLIYANHLYFNGKEVSNLVIPNGVTSIGANAFYNCTGLTSITIPNSVTSIGYRSFYNCSNLSTIKLGKSVKTITNYAFANCDNISDVVCLAKSVPSTQTDAFNNSYIDYATLYVYETSIEAYKTQTPWNEFKSIVEADIPMYTLTYIIDGDVYKTIKYEEGDKIIPEQEPTKEGYVFSGWSEIPEEMPAKNVLVTGTFTKNSIEKPQLSAPSISLVKGKLVFSCDETDVTYHYGITTTDIQGDGNDVELPHSYRVSVYSSKEGFRNSEISTKDIVVKNGDVNLDGNIDISDHVELTNIIMSSGTENLGNK